MPCHFEDHPTAPVTPALSLVAIDRNRWSRSIGIGGRDQSEQVVAISRNAHTKGRGSAFRQADSIAVIPMVPELDTLISEMPADRLVFIHSAHDRPYSCTEGLGNRIREWRRDCGLPEGLSAHSMRKAATHWWLRNHRDLLANNFSLKTIFGWVTDKELERYTADFDRAQEARGMLIKLAVRHKAGHG